MDDPVNQTTEAVEELARAIAVYELAVNPFGRRWAPSVRFRQTFNRLWESDFPEWNALRARCRAAAAHDPTLQIALENAHA